MSSNIQTRTSTEASVAAKQASYRQSLQPLTQKTASIQSSLQRILALKSARGATRNNTASMHARTSNDVNSESKSPKVLEEDLFSAAVHLQLAKKSSDFGDHFILQLSSKLAQNKQTHGSENMFKAADRVLRQLQRSGDISKAEYQEIKAFAFGKAQLDQDRTEVAWTNYRDLPIESSLGNSTNQSSASVDAALRKFDSNEPASELEMAIFRVKEAFNSLLLSLVRNQSSYQNSRTDTQVSAQHASQVRAHGGSTSSATSHMIDSSKYAETIATPGGFLWKPISDSDGKLAILLPPWLTTNAIGCRILSPDGSRVLASGRYSGVGNGDRQHFRFNSPGASFPNGSIVEIQLRNGTTMQIKIGETGARLEGK